MKKVAWNSSWMGWIEKLLWWPWVVPTWLSVSGVNRIWFHDDESIKEKSQAVIMWPPRIRKLECRSSNDCYSQCQPHHYRWNKRYVTIQSWPCLIASGTVCNLFWTNYYIDYICISTEFVYTKAICLKLKYGRSNIVESTVIEERQQWPLGGELVLKNLHKSTITLPGNSERNNFYIMTN